MPSFFEGLKRLATGQPVFKQGEGVDSEQPHVEQPDNVAVGAPATTEQNGPKVIPQVIIERTEHRNNGAHMDVDFEIKNHSDRDVFIDRVSVLGQSRQISIVLRPGEQREVPVFSGPRPNHRNYSDSELKYRDETTGDYFATSHFVEFEQEQDQTYVIRNIRFVPPVRDI